MDKQIRFINGIELDFYLNDNKLNIERFENFMHKKYLESHLNKQHNYEDTTIDLAKIKILKTIYPDSLFNIGVEIRPSPIHRKGVFATRDINVGEFITFYPGDAVIRYNVYSFSDRYRCKHRTKDKLIKNVKDTYTYSFSNFEYSIWGNPKLIDNPAYIGHMINDSPDFNPNNCNSEFYDMKNNLGVMIRAKKNIKKDEEILLSYGRGYWLARGKSKYLPRLD